MIEIMIMTGSYGGMVVMMITGVIMTIMVGRLIMIVIIMTIDHLIIDIELYSYSYIALYIAI